MKQKDSFHPNIGTSSILMIFVVLCLTTFGILSLVTANADKKISAKNADTVANYYDTSAQVQKSLQLVDTALAAARTDAGKAVQNPLFLVAMDDSVYSENAQAFQTVNTLLKSGAPQHTKLAESYRYFARCRVARNQSVAVGDSEDGLTVSFAEKTGSARSIQVTLLVLPFDSTQRYRVLEEKLVTAQSQDAGDGTLQLWQGDSSAAN